MNSAMCQTFIVLLQLLCFTTTILHSVAEPIQPGFPSDFLDDVTTAEVNETGEETATYNPSFDGDNSLVHHFTFEEIEANRWISIDRSGVEYTATDAEVIKNLDKALQLQKKHYNAVIDTFVSHQNATAQKRAVFLPDERYLSATRYQIGYLNTGCTAFLIGPYHALTAGHCVYDCSQRRWMSGTTELDLYAGRNCYTSGRRMRWVRVWTQFSQCSGYYRLFNTGYDIAWIKYETYDQSTSWLGFGWLTANPTICIELCGYPADTVETYNCLSCSSCNDCRYRRDSYMTTTKTGFWGWRRKTVTRYKDNDKAWQYTCDTTHGHSGAPLVVSRSGYIWAVGVHVLESRSAGLNYGNRITCARYTEIHTWLCQNGYCPSTITL